MQSIAPSVSVSVSVPVPVIISNNYNDNNNDINYIYYDDTDITIAEFRHMKRKILFGKILSVLFFSFFVFIFMFNILLMICNSVSLANKLETNIYCFDTQLNSSISKESIIVLVISYILNNFVILLINYSLYRTWNKNFSKYFRDKWILYSCFCFTFFLSGIELFIGYNRYETKKFLSCFFILLSVFNLGYSFLSIVYSDFLHE